ncbi:MAG: DNA recombination protein RmuC [Gammaproteobacteria bacterium]
MVIPESIIVLLIAFTTAVAGFFVAHFLRQQDINALLEQRARLQSQLDSERKLHMERMRIQNQTRSQLHDSFKALASDTLRNNSSEFLKLAEANLRQYQLQANSEFSQRQKAVENLVAPIHQALEKTERQIKDMEKERQQAFGALHQQVKDMAEANLLLQGETRNLSQALRRPEIRGQWGELTLKRLAELAGMSEHCDFYAQESISTDTGMQRPDMIVRLSDKREIIIDAKTPLDAYLSAIDASDDKQRQQHLKRHARSVRERVRELSSKHYWQQLPRSPEFVVLFIPGDQFLSSALEIDTQLLEDALIAKVILATPTSLVALLRTIAYGWRQKVLTENADLIRQTGEDLYDRLRLFSEHLSKVGKGLNSSVDAYNRAVSSFEARVIPGVRRFSDMGISSKKDIKSLQRVETQPRHVVSETDSAN